MNEHAASHRGPGRKRGQRSHKAAPARHAAVMGQPLYFGGLGSRSPSPGDARPSAFRGRANREHAMQQWRVLAELLSQLGIDVFVAPPDRKRPDAALAGGAGLVTDLTQKRAVADKRIICSTSALSDEGFRLHYERFLRGLGFVVDAFDAPFGGAADVVRCGDHVLYGWGETSPPRRLFGRRHGFGSDRSLREAVGDAVGDAHVFEIELIDPRYPRLDMCVSAIGPHERILMVHVNALHEDAQRVILGGKSKIADFIIPLSDQDAAMYAASSLQIEDADGSRHLLIPEGVSDELLGRIEAVGVRPTPVDLSEWIKKDLGGVRSLVLDLGWMVDDRRTRLAEIVDFRKRVRFRSE